jgi:hypothetical protein
MSTLCRAYATEDDARAAVDRLLAGGAPAADVRVLMGAALHDARDAPAGSFAGAGSPAVGSYAGSPHSVRDGMGGYAGDPGEQRRGGFSDVDRDSVRTYRDGVERVRIAQHHDLRGMLLDAGLDRATADADVEALHHGRVLVLVRSEMAAGDVAAALDG